MFYGLMILYVFENIFFSLAINMSRQGPDPAGSVFNLPLGSGSVIHVYESTDPDKQEMFTDPQHWFIDD